MSTIIQLLVTGLAMGFIYCLVAIEYTLIWNSCGVCNFAHEKFIVLAAFFFGNMMLSCGGDLVLSLISTFLFMGIFGFGVALLIIIPLKKLPSTVFTVMGAVTLSFFMKEALRHVFGPLGYSVPNFLQGYVRFFGISISVVYFYIVVVSIILLLLQKSFFSYTKAGRAVRAVQQDPVAAAIMGINVPISMAISVAFSSIICAIVGILVIPLFSVGHNMASLIALKGFSAGIVGGFGTYSGAIIGGLTIGLIESGYSFFGPTVYKDVVSFVIMIVFLILKPNGIAGKRNTYSGKISRTVGHKKSEV